MERKREYEYLREIVIGKLITVSSSYKLFIIKISLRLYGNE